MNRQRGLVTLLLTHSSKATPRAKPRLSAPSRKLGNKVTKAPGLRDEKLKVLQS